MAVAAFLAAALTLPSLNNGLGIDDHMYRARVLEGWDAARSARDLFLYADPDRPAQAREAMARGELSWWAAPRLRWRFFRPLAQIVHHVEFRLAGRGGERLMHLHSVLWMAALAALVTVLYRRLLAPAWVAGLAAIFYAIDHGHGFTVGWLANRCMLMAAVFAVLCLIAHDRWRRDGWRPGAVLARWRSRWPCCRPRRASRSPVTCSRTPSSSIAAPAGPGRSRSHRRPP